MNLDAGLPQPTTLEDYKRLTLDEVAAIYRHFLLTMSSMLANVPHAGLSADEEQRFGVLMNQRGQFFDVLAIAAPDMAMK